MDNTNLFQEKLKLAGIKGWLLFFILILTIISPIQFLIKFIGDFNINIFSDFPLASPFEFIVFSIINFLFVVFGVYTGIILWKIKPYAVRITKIYLYIMIIAIIIITAFNSILKYIAIKNNSPAMYLHFKDIFVDLLWGFIVLIYFLIWIFYFKYSRRVKSTFNL